MMPMDESELKKLIESGESETAEFKPSLSQMNEIVESISAFSNSSGGVLLVGVSNSGKILGVEAGKDSIERLSNKISQGTDPKIYPKLSIDEIGGKKIIAIEVGESKNKPHLAFGRFFKRVGKSTLLASRDELEKLILHKKKVYWDEETCEKATVDDIDVEKAMWYLKRRATVRGIDIPQIPLNQILLGLKAVVKSNAVMLPTNAGILFFGKSPQRFIQYSEVKLARFKGTNAVEFIDRLELGGTIPQLIDEAEKFVKRNTRRATKIVGFEQVNIPEYPYEALREAITNAVVHRDYSFSGSSIRVMIFDDRVEVESPGRLPEGITIKTLEGSHVLRNERIANLLYDVAYIEKWGTGIQRMKGLMLKHGLKEPVFEERGESFKVTFYGPGDKILDLVNSIPKDRRTDLKKLGLNGRQIESLRLMTDRMRTFTNREYRELFKVTDRTALRDLKELVERGLVVKEGFKKDAIYRYVG